MVSLYFQGKSMGGQFIISLDFELLWGVRDHSGRTSPYGRNILGAREAIPQILDRFTAHHICATWAIVGFLFCESKEQLMASLPDEKPAYDNPRFSSYHYLDEVGENEASDPYYFGSSLVDQIIQTPLQEVATHTLSHYYCLEAGQSIESFDADLLAAKRLAAGKQVTLQSIVFPRNQYAQEHLEVCRNHGITNYRGNPKGWAYAPSTTEQQSPARRALRLADAYTGALGPHAFTVQSTQGLRNVPASRFLRPCAGKLAPLHPLHIATICREMTAAAKRNQSYHLWWHPHNFGVNTDQNLEALQTILTHFNALKDRYGMTSVAMKDAL